MEEIRKKGTEEGRREKEEEDRGGMEEGRWEEEH